ncbi:hypothetical protein NUU61_002917 [Penicillium alfredii]|uniref:Uncharacterized protein n=1 Tax=Penicillium alfredii TaxID=1506179 RepID=A0A9W9KGG7_9EURO|nr:uncharacterized protein NUU61_002917 [Penicillium alfredii]KAJ5105570.1 hypothetical protein NUU61_002917 [Penicillium alfredii]
MADDRKEKTTQKTTSASQSSAVVPVGYREIQGYDRHRRDVEERRRRGPIWARRGLPAPRPIEIPGCETAVLEQAAESSTPRPCVQDAPCSDPFDLTVTCPVIHFPCSQTPRTEELFEAWESCPDKEDRYPGYAHWKMHMVHEQSIVTEVLRFDFAAHLRLIDSQEGNGYPQKEDDCKGELVQYYWPDKWRIGDGVKGSIAQYLWPLMHSAILRSRHTLVVDVNNPGAEKAVKATEEEARKAAGEENESFSIRKEKEKKEHDKNEEDG